MEEVSRVTNCWEGSQEVVEHILVLPTCTEDVGKTLSSKNSAKKSVNRQALLKILSNVQFLARQALPLRGDKVGEINFNFSQLYYLQAEDNLFLNDWMKWKDDKYPFKDTQNEMMKVMELQVLWEIAVEMPSADFFHYHDPRGHRCCKHFTAYIVHKLGGR